MIRMRIQKICRVITGSREQWYRRLLPLYGSWKGRQLEMRIRREQNRVLMQCGIAFGVTVVFFLAALFYGGDGTQEPVNAEDILQGGTYRLEYRGITQEIGLEEPVQDVTKNTEEIFREARKIISGEMLGNNQDWDHVAGKLCFPKELESGVYVRYETSDPRRISEEGFVDGIGAESGIEVVISVTMLYQEKMERYEVRVRVVPPETEEDVEQALLMRAGILEQEVEKVRNNSSEFETSVLDHISVSVPKKETVFGPFAVMGIAIIASLVFGKFHHVERERELYRKRISDDLPFLMDQLILMMNAGLILSEALEMASETTCGDVEGGLLSDVRYLCERAEETKQPVTTLLCEHAVETGCPELVRFSTMLADHVNRGSASLIRQLKMERNYSMESRWKQQEGKIQRMEVQLSGPLFLVLAVILLLTIGPVLIGF